MLRSSWGSQRRLVFLPVFLRVVVKPTVVRSSALFAILALSSLRIATPIALLIQFRTVAV